MSYVGHSIRGSPLPVTQRKHSQTEEREWGMRSVAPVTQRKHTKTADREWAIQSVVPSSFDSEKAQSERGEEVGHSICGYHICVSRSHIEETHLR